MVKGGLFSQAAVRPSVVFNDEKTQAAFLMP